MFKISVSNIHGQSWTKTAETENEATIWIEKHKSKKTFGLPERKVRQDKKPRDLEYTEVEKYKLDLHSFELILNEETGMPEVDGIEYEVIYPCEYEIIIEEVGSVLDIEDAWKGLREKRDKLLRDTDYTQLADAPIKPDAKKMYREYRQYLRRLPNGYNDEHIRSYKIESFREWRNRVYPQ